MGKEEMMGNFTKTMIMLAKTSYLVEDKFFSEKFKDKMNQFSYDFFNFLLEHGKGNVAQYQVLAQKCLANIDYILDIFKELEYLGVIEINPLLLKTESSLLSVKLDILRKKGLTEINHGEPELAKKEIIENNKLTESKKKILDYIKSYPNTRAKDIIYEFNTLSDRTVKRNLTDLIRAGFVKKRVDNKAVYYYADEVQNPSL